MARFLGAPGANRALVVYLPSIQEVRLSVMRSGRPRAETRIQRGQHAEAEASLFFLPTVLNACLGLRRCSVSRCGEPQRGSCPDLCNCEATNRPRHRHVITWMVCKALAEGGSSCSPMHVAPIHEFHRRSPVTCLIWAIFATCGQITCFPFG